MKTMEILRDYNNALSEWEIREAIITDAASIVTYLEVIAREPELNTRFRPSTLPTTHELHAEIEAYKNNNQGKIFIAAKQGQVIGLLYITRGNSPFVDHMVELSINVDQNFRGMGIGSKLMRLALDWASTKPDIKRVELHVLKRNTDAIRLYERLGFMIEGRLRNAYHMVDEGQNHYEDAIIMAVCHDGL